MKTIYDLIPEKFFTTSLKDNALGSIKIAVLREVIGNAIIRSNYPDETITFKLSEMRDVVEVPARKLKSREKLLGLKLCREFGVVDKELRYNVIKKSQQLANPNSVLFGDSVTESGDSVALTSRVIYDWAYSLRDINQITATLQHNALSEGGTMWNEEEGKLRQSLFQVQYVKPGTYLPHFITLENITPELFVHLLLCVMNETRYFAQSTTTSTANVKNHILGIGFADFEQPVNSYSISKNWNNDDVNYETTSASIDAAMTKAYGEQGYVKGEKLVSLVNELWQDKEGMNALYAKAHADCEQYLKDIHIVKAKGGK
ncbi:type I-D CRISPR-associated protein Cas7/Csc2 [Fulvivirga maritima]|uniref:type I-D CRISPR-associated protein Cas7/Csc2 n=1 Tax=Fulvivirga maritima TaxID=2904247 RepID=UPI001F39302F|nr:type I-D CRISPR-associated protein Cas7/Csc2 [Fulvivirga maritima]UII25132.1 type I-D CRISPR-associated protein Cas7/Csc2 [Fulvivirga maritima]